MIRQRFDLAALAAVPWKNGAGLTREIVCRPAGAGMNDFDWRVSIASITAPGPFSAFDGVDRVIVLLEGGGVRLRSADARIDHRLDVPLAPFAFAGEAVLACELLGGASTDFNVMTRRDRCRAEVRVLTGDTPLRAANARLLFAVRGNWRVDGLEPLTPGSGAWWDTPSGEAHAASEAPDSAMIAVHIDSLATRP